MKEHLEEAITRVEALKDHAALQQASRTDLLVGRIVGAIKALAWIVSAVFFYFVGDLLVAHSDGWTEYAAIMVSFAGVIYSIWRAYRGLFHARRASELIADEIIDRVKPAQRAMEFAQRFRGGKPSVDA